MRGAVLAILFALLPSGVPARLGAPQAGRDEFHLQLQAPIRTWDEAIPLGNGLTGGLLWGEGRTLRLSLDRADLWDLRTPELYRADDWNYATIQRLVRARDQKELVRRFDAPFEEIPYPTKLPGARLELTLPEGCEARAFMLDLSEAVGRAAFDGGSAEAYFSATEPVALVRVRGAVPAFALVPPAGLVKLGYKAPQRGGDAASTWLVQETALGIVYAVHVARRTVSAGVTEFALAMTSSREGRDVLAMAKSRTASALARGYDLLLVPHRQWWRRFWASSSVTLPDAAIQRQYNLVQYFYGAGARRGAPPIPLQGVWTADAGSRRGRATSTST